MSSEASKRHTNLAELQLLRCVEHNDIEAVVSALTQGANPNWSISVSTTSTAPSLSTSTPITGIATSQTTISTPPTSLTSSNSGVVIVASKSNLYGRTILGYAAEEGTRENTCVRDVCKKSHGSSNNTTTITTTQQ